MITEKCSREGREGEDRGSAHRQSKAVFSRTLSKDAGGKGKGEESAPPLHLAWCGSSSFHEMGYEKQELRKDPTRDKPLLTLGPEVVWVQESGQEASGRTQLKRTGRCHSCPAFPRNANSSLRGHTGMQTRL